MSDLRRLLMLGAATCLVARGAAAQDLAAWKQRAAEQLARVEAADAGVKAAEPKKTYDRVIVVEDVRMSYASGDLTPEDTASIRGGFEDAITELRTRYGAAGVALAAGAHWTVEHYRPSQMLRKDGLQIYHIATPHVGGSLFELGAAREGIRSLVLAHAGERLTATTPALAHYNGWAALQPDRTMYVELARRFATSWSGAARRCSAGALEACAVILAPFDAYGEPSRYFDPSDFRLVVETSGYPPHGDSLYFDARRRCGKGEDSVCARIIERVPLPDPINSQVRGTLLSHAIELGGTDAIVRAGQRLDAPSLELLAHIAGVSADSLLGSWRVRVLGALDAERRVAGFPTLFTSIVWGGLMFLAATKRRYL